jgi:hypothetical protein
MTIHPPTKSTIVRFKVMAAASLWVGCTATGPAPTAAAPCAAQARLACETFATDRRCECTSRAELERSLAAFGTAAWPGGNH